MISFDVGLYEHVHFRIIVQRGRSTVALDTQGKLWFSSRKDEPPADIDFLLKENKN